MSLVCFYMLFPHHDKGKPEISLWILFLCLAVRLPERSSNLIQHAYNMFHIYT